MSAIDRLLGCSILPHARKYERICAQAIELCETRMKFCKAHEIWTILAASVYVVGSLVGRVVLGASASLPFFWFFTGAWVSLALIGSISLAVLERRQIKQIMLQDKDL